MKIPAPPNRTGGLKLDFDGPNAVQEARDLTMVHLPDLYGADPREWPKDQIDLWAVLFDLGTEIINGFELDETYFDDMERYNGITANDV